MEEINENTSENLNSEIEQPSVSVRELVGSEVEDLRSAIQSALVS